MTRNDLKLICVAGAARVPGSEFKVPVPSREAFSWEVGPPRRGGMFVVEAANRRSPQRGDMCGGLMRSSS